MFSEKQNQPGWYRSPLAGSEELEPLPAFFMKCVPVDVPRHFTKVNQVLPLHWPLHTVCVPNDVLGNSCRGILLVEERGRE